MYILTDIFSPIEFQGQKFLTTATEWTKKRIFSGNESNHNDNNNNSSGAVTSSGNNSPSPPVSVNTGGEPNEYHHHHATTGPSPHIDFGPNGEAIIAYFSCVQVWTFGNDAYNFAGSTHDIEGKVIDATLLNNNKKQQHRHSVLVQVLKRSNTVLEIHELNSKPSLIQTLVLPPSSTGPSPYNVVSPPEGDYLCIVASNGLVSIFAIREEDYHCLPISGIETELKPSDGSPLLDICGRWLVYSNPKQQGYNKQQTPMKLPPSSPLYERVMENVSSTAVAGLKSLSDAGVAGIRHYFKLDENDNKHGENGSVHDSPHPTNNNANGGSIINRVNGLFTDSASKSASTIEIIDIPTETTVCKFNPLDGLSHLSLSPYDATLATVSSRGDYVYTYDLSFLPTQISVAGRYTRGKLPATVHKVLWDNHGGLGIITSEKGSLHWFDKRRTVDNSNKVWKLSGWGIETGISGNIILAEENPEKKKQTRHQNTSCGILILKQNQVMITDPTNGVCIWKYDLPWTAIEEENSSQAKDEITNNNKHHDTIDKSTVEPLSFYEMETCLPYPYIHTDRRILFSTFSTDDQGYNDQYDTTIISTDIDSNIKIPILNTIGLPIKTSIIDFGRACGQAKFSPDIVGSNGPIEEDDDDGEIRKAMESMVLLKNEEEEEGTTPRIRRRSSSDNNNTSNTNPDYLIDHLTDSFIDEKI